MSQNGYDPRSQAKRMRGEGASYQAIAQALGVGSATVYSWLNPAYAERQRAMSLAAKRRRKTACPDCGVLVGYEYPGEPCADCKLEAEYGERNRRIVAAWNAGEDAAVIACREGMSETAVRTDISNWQLNGKYEVNRRTRRPREDWGYIQRAWNVDGETAAQIAAALDTTDRNVYMMIAHMRRAGLHVARRQRRKVPA